MINKSILLRVEKYNKLLRFVFYSILILDIWWKRICVGYFLVFRFIGWWFLLGLLILVFLSFFMDRWNFFMYLEKFIS